MIRVKPTSALGSTVALRFGGRLFDRLREHLSHDRSNEQFAFALCRHINTEEGTTLLVHELFLPTAGDLSEQSGGGVCPSKRFMRMVYGRAWASGSTILDIHTHPHPGVPSFSGIDTHHAQKNAKYITETFPDPVTHAMVVFGDDVEGHDAVVYDRGLRKSRPIDRIEVLGRPTKIRPTGKHRGRRHADPRYDRQRLIPGWDQDRLARLRVAIVGAGGTGSQVFQTLVSLGVGTLGWIALIDHDDIEASNLPRVQYAAPRHIGCSKVGVARAYAKVRNPKITVHAIAERIRSVDDVPMLRAASVIIGAGDNDGVRRLLNETSARNLIPYIDLGCDIQVGDEVHAGGQARVVIPGENACLTCCGGFDPSEAALDLLDDADVEARARHGYVRGADAAATPSVVNLNATTAQMGVTALLALLQGEVFGDWDYARYDQLRGEMITASSSRSETCPVCGPDGVLALAGEEPPDAPVEITSPVSAEAPAESDSEEPAVEAISSPALEKEPDLSEAQPSVEVVASTEPSPDPEDGPAAGSTTDDEPEIKERRPGALSEVTGESHEAENPSESAEPLWVTAPSAQKGETGRETDGDATQTDSDAVATPEPDVSAAAVDPVQADR